MLQSRQHTYQCVNEPRADFRSLTISGTTTPAPTYRTYPYNSAPYIYTTVQLKPVLPRSESRQARDRYEYPPSIARHSSRLTVRLTRVEPTKRKVAFNCPGPHNTSISAQYSPTSSSG